MEAVLPKPSLKVLGRLLGGFAISLLCWYVIRFPYSRTLASSGAAILSVLGASPQKELISVRGAQFYIASGLKDSGGRPQLQELRIDSLHWNSIIFGSMIFLASGRVLKARWMYVMSAAALLWCTHLVFFVLMTLTALAVLYGSRGMDFLNPRLLNVISVVSLVQGSILAPVIPFFLSAPLFMTRLPVRAVRAGNAAPAGRNQLCPCGSGKKFKRCCGK